MPLLLPKPIKQEKKKKPLNRNGKKTTAWEKTRAELKVRFEQAGITRCELEWPGCFKDNFLSFAHGKKRRYIKTQEELEFTILTCNHCHQELEYGSNMYEIVRDVIARRKVKA